MDWRKLQITLSVCAILLGSLAVFEMVMVKPGAVAEVQGAVAPVPASPAVLGVRTDSSARGEVAEEEPGAPIQATDTDFSDVSAHSFLVFDAKTGVILAERNADEESSIASLTKLLTALVAYEELDMESLVTVAASDRIDVTPVLNLQVGDQVKVKDLWSAMLVGSCNDAARALARAASEKSGKSFTDLMNDKAEALGMKSSRFSNPMGFDSRFNYSTAKDVKLLVQETQKYAAFTNLGKSKSYSFRGAEGRSYTAKATNKLIGRYPDIEAVKTGFTQDTQGAMIVRVSQKDKRFVIVVLGSKNREQDTLLIRSIVMESFRWP